MKTESYRSILISELEKRKERNSAYSLRAFSRQLKLSPAQLSKIISGKKPLTPKTAAKIADALAFTPLERAAFVESTVSDINEESSVNPREIREEEFHLIADWYHFAILSLSELKHHKSDPRWIASQLGIKVSEASDAVFRLQKLNVIEVRNGKMRQVMKPLKTATDIPSAAIRLHHFQNFEQAKRKLEETAVEEREYTSITMAISRKKIPQAKKMMTQFKRKLSTLLENGEKDAVYTLSLQLFPVSRLEKP